MEWRTHIHGKSFYLYFIVTEEDKEYPYRFVKIGITTDLNSRIAAVQVGCPLRLEFYSAYLMQSNTLALLVEKSLHRKFSASHTSGEWFKLTSLIINWVRKEGLNIGENAFMLREENEIC